MTKVLVVDDHEDAREYLLALLHGHGWQADTAENGADALAKARLRLPDLVVSDLLMPVMDGYTLLRHWKADRRLSKVPFVVYTATYTDDRDRELAMDLGADAFIVKPAEPQPLWDRLAEVVQSVRDGRLAEPRRPADDGVAVLDRYNRVLVRKLESKMQQLAEANKRLEQDMAMRLDIERALRESLAETSRVAEELSLTARRLTRTVEGVVQSMGAMVAARDPYTAHHERRVTSLAVAIGERMGMSGSGLDAIRLAGLVHDVGKLMVPVEILVKPTRLSDAEFELVRQHPRAAFEMLRPIEFQGPVADIVHQHHERMDGSGYPLGLRGAEILPEARVLAVADVVEAMASHRPYRPALGVPVALEEICAGAGSRYAADVVDACRQVFEAGFRLAD